MATITVDDANMIDQSRKMATDERSENCKSRKLENREENTHICTHNKQYNVLAIIHG